MIIRLSMFFLFSIKIIRCGDVSIFYSLTVLQFSCCYDLKEAFFSVFSVSICKKIVWEKCLPMPCLPFVDFLGTVSALHLFVIFRDFSQVESLFAFTVSTRAICWFTHSPHVPFSYRHAENLREKNSRHMFATIIYIIICVLKNNLRHILKKG